MNKMSGKKSDFAYLREDASRIIIGYGLKEVSGDLFEWYEVKFYKKQKSSLSLQDVKDAVIADINARTDEKILTGFVWTPASGEDPIPVWLSTENQFNFKAAYDLAVQKQGLTLPVTFKMSEREDGTPVYHTFGTMDDADDFYTKAIEHINQTLVTGWREKDAIDWTPYEALFPAHDQSKNQQAE